MTRNTVESLKSKLLSEIPALASKDQDFALLDFPDYSNVGDSLIWLGEIAFFESKYGRGPDYVCTTTSFDAEKLRRLAPSGPIYLSGGGNFGDLWPRFQNFRIEVLRAFPDRRIIQLPQTIQFSAPSAIEATRAAIAAHPDFTLLVRDHQSLVFARSNFSCEIGLMPDMAFCMGPLQPVGTSVTDQVYLIRTDKETSQYRGMMPEGEIAIDWIHRSETANLPRKISRKFLTLLNNSGFAPNDHNRFKKVAEAERARGIALLSRGRSVVTDRLHGHILSVLLGLPNAVLDNSYGKISGFVEAWTKDDEGVHLSDSIENARAWLIEHQR